MKVLINEKSYEYISDYPHEWKFISKDHFKYPVSIGNNDCFIKRFQRRHETITGWDLLKNLKNKNEINLPKVHDIVSVEENNRLVHYAFFEHKKGKTLDALLSAREPIDLERLTNDLFSAFRSLHKHQYWFTDFCEKNIFCEDSGKFLLIDVDSCAALTVVPNNNMDVNMLYLAQVLKFFKDVLHIALSPSEIPGIALNYLQIIFLILNVKLFLSGDSENYLPDSTFNTLSVKLDEIDPAFRELFKEVLKAVKDTTYSFDVLKIKELIVHKIIVLRDQPAEASTTTEQQRPSDKPSTDETAQTREQSGSSDRTAKAIKADEKPEHRKATRAEKHLDPIPKPPSLHSNSSRQKWSLLLKKPVFWIGCVSIFAVVMIALWFNGARDSSAGINIKKPEKEIQEPVNPGSEQEDKQVHQPENGGIQPEDENSRQETETDPPEVPSNTGAKPPSTSQGKTEKTEIDQQKDKDTAESTTASGSLPQTCIAVCRTKGISGIEVSFSDSRTNKRYTLVSGGKDLEFIVPCDLLKETVEVSFRANGQPEYRNVKLKEFEIPEMFRNN